MQAMFNPPDPLEFKKPVSKRKVPSVDGIASILSQKPDLFEKGPPPPREKFETPRQRHARVAALKRKVSVPPRSANLKSRRLSCDNGQACSFSVRRAPSGG